MYEIYKKLLDEKGFRNADVARGTGVSNMTLSDWKHGKSTPKTENMKKIADFLGVSVDYLMGSEKSEINTDRAEADVLFLDIPERLKIYALKLSELSETDQKTIMQMIDRLRN